MTVKEIQASDKMSTAYDFLPKQVVVTWTVPRLGWIN